MDHYNLVGHSVKALNTFDPERRAIEEHINQYLKFQTDLKEEDQVFIVEVFSGCVRYSNVLKVILNSYFNKDGRNCLRSEGNLYRVIAYLALFRMDELGFTHFRKFVNCQHLNRMYKFLNFALSDKNVQTWMKDEWCKLYDASWVQTNLLSPIQRWMPEIEEFIIQLKDRVEAKLKPKQSDFKPTETKPFSLTQQRPRSIPIPEPIPTLARYQEVPKTTYKDPDEFDVMAKIKEINRRKAEERLMEASKIQFACANAEKSDKTKDIMNDIVEEANSKLNFDGKPSNPVPFDLLNDNVPFKLTAAAILREKRLYKEREAKEIKKLQQLEEGAFDASTFNQWQNKMMTMDTNNKLADIERRKIDSQLTHEQAIIAKHETAIENRKKVESMREEAVRLMEEYMKDQLVAEERRKTMVQRVQDTHENAKEAKTKMQQFKAKIVQQVVEESKELMRQALEEAEREMKERMVLIRQIRAMEAVPTNRNKLVDFTTTGGFGFLSEMSIMELNERITLLRIQKSEDEEDKRDQILAQKQANDEKLLDALATISRHRTENTRAAAVRFEAKKKNRNNKPEIKDEKLQELQRQLEEKRALRMRQQQTTRIEPPKHSAHRLKQLGQDKKSLEERRWRELELTRQRTANVATQGNEETSRMGPGTMLFT